MRKEVIVLLLLFLALPIVSASQVFGSWVKYGQDFTVGNTTFTPIYDLRNEIMLLEINTGQKMIMKKGACQLESELTVCFKNVTLNMSAGRGSIVNFVEYPDMYITVNTREGRFSVKRSFSETSPDIGENLIVTAEMKNTGEVMIYNIQYADKLPAEFRLKSGTTPQENIYLWTGSLAPGDNKTMSYMVEMRQPFNGDSDATVSYMMDNAYYQISAGKVKITSKTFFELEAGFDKSTIEVDEDAELTVTINNEYDGQLNINSILIAGPKELIGSSQFFRQKSPGIYEYTGLRSSIDEDKDGRYSLKLRPTIEGSHKLNISVDLRANGYSEKKAKEVTLTTGFTPLEIQYKGRNDFRIGERIPMEVYLINENEHTHFKDARVTFVSDFLSVENVTLADVVGKANVMNMTYRVPAIEGLRKLKIDATAFVNGKQYNYTKTIDFNITSGRGSVLPFDKPEEPVVQNVSVPVVNETPAVNETPVEVQQNVSVDTTAVVPEPEKGFFGRIADWFRGLFG